MGARSPREDARDTGGWPDTGAGPRAPRRDDRWRELRPATDESVRLAPDEELVAGRRPVEEAFAARRPALRLLVVPQRRQALERVVLHATTLRIPIIEVEGGTLTSLAGFDGHQGVALVVEPRRYASLDQVLARAIERREAPFVLVLDSLEDPQNVGTLLRSAEAAGVHGVLFPTERQAPITPAAVKASAGATEHLLLCPVDDLPAALADLHVRGVRVVGSDAEAPMTTREADLRGPVAIVVGSEGQGLGPAVRRRCDLFVRIPMRGSIGSLNASVAGSVLLFEALGQRDPDARPEPVEQLPAPASPGDAPSGAVKRRRVSRSHVPDEPAAATAENATAEVEATAPPRARRARRGPSAASSPAPATTPLEGGAPAEESTAGVDAAGVEESVTPPTAEESFDVAMPGEVGADAPPLEGTNPAEVPDVAIGDPDGDDADLLPGRATPRSGTAAATPEDSRGEPDLA